MEAAAVQTLVVYGPLGVAALALGYVGWKIINSFIGQCEARTSAALEAFKDESTKNREVIDKNTEAFHGVQTALVRLQDKVDAK